MSVNRWTLGPGRALTLDGVEVLDLQRVGTYGGDPSREGGTLTPRDADELARGIVKLLNASPVWRKKWRMP